MNILRSIRSLSETVKKNNIRVDKILKSKRSTRLVENIKYLTVLYGF